MNLEVVIRRIDFARLDVAMKKPFGIAGGAQDVARNVLVTIELDDGTRGYGEAAPLPAFNGETQEKAIVALERAARMLVGGHEGGFFGDLPEQIAEVTGGVGSAACALETAMLDAQARSLGKSLRDMFGKGEPKLVTDVTITTGTVDEARDEARAFDRFSTLKIKIGATPDLDVDIARILAVHEARPSARILIDANASLDVDRAVRLVEELRKKDVRPALLEEPLPPRSFEALAEIRSRAGVPIAIDESATTMRDVLEAHQCLAADVVNVKLMKGGILRAMEIFAGARAVGMKLMIGGMVETRLAMGTSACFAAGMGGFSFVDLDTPLFLAEDPFEGGYTQDGERIDLSPITLGHGCTPRTSDPES
jgi:L-alanine-DL-glutamate epimerase-like enolase superfamily enzyme